MKLFSGTSSRDLAEKMSRILGVVHASAEEHVFPDGERRIRISEDVVDETVVVVQSACPPVDSNYMELFFLIDSLSRSGAETTTAIVPYFGYQRQDHIFRDGEAVSLEVIIRILESLGIDKLVSVDMHSIRIPDLFHIPVMHISALPLFAAEIQEKKWHTKETVLVSPDMGGIARIKKLADLLGDMPYVALDKNRDLVNGSIDIDAVAEGSLINRKRAIIIDDMVSSGKTALLAASFLQKKGIEEVIVMATHAILSQDASSAFQKSDIVKVYVTDTVMVPEGNMFEKLEVLSVAPLLAQAIKE